MSSSDHPESGLAGPKDDSGHELQEQHPQAAAVSTETAEPQTSSETKVQTTEHAAAKDTPVDGGDSASAAAPAPASDAAADADAVAPTNAPQTQTEEETKAATATATSTELKTSETQAKEVEEEDSGPSLVITLLLISGSRHPFKIDGKYLRKQAVNVENHDPFLMSVYTLKELIWREWRSDWEPRPTSPSSIRLISFGKLLEDKAPLSDSKFSRDAPNVVHMTIKPQELVDEEDAKGAKTQYTREREASERSPGCRCVIL